MPLLNKDPGVIAGSVAGLVLGTIASLPAGDTVVTLSLGSMLAVGSGITGYILTQVENAR